MSTPHLSEYLLLALLVLSAIWTVMAGHLLKSAVMLALASVLMSTLLFQFGAALAAAFELSVCAGLITVVLMSSISLTAVRDQKGKWSSLELRFKRFFLLPILLVLLAALLLFLDVSVDPDVFNRTLKDQPVREVLWNLRGVDLVGQMVAILAGVWGVVLLFKDQEGEEEGNAEGRGR